MNRRSLREAKAKIKIINHQPQTIKLNNIQPLLSAKEITTWRWHLILNQDDQTVTDPHSIDYGTIKQGDRVHL